jgi:ubiquitin
MKPRKKKMKTNKEKNIEHDRKQAEKVRPKGPAFDFTELEAAVRRWLIGK